MASNRGVAYIKPGQVEVQSIDFPKLYDPARKKKIEHGVILKIISTNICGSDQHMVRGRTTAPAGLILGHEITGEVIETGPDVEFIHCTGLTEPTWQALADNGVHVSIAVPIEMQMRHGMPPIQQALDYGIRPSLSSDVDTNMAQDAFTLMRSASRPAGTEPVPTTRRRRQC